MRVEVRTGLQESVLLAFVQCEGRDGLRTGLSYIGYASMFLLVLKDLATSGRD